MDDTPTLATPMNEQIIDVLCREDIAPNAYVSAMCRTIQERHPERVLGFLYYGSSLREMNNPDKMLDFYVLVDSYRKTHKGRPIRAFFNALIPPCVFYQEQEHEDSHLSTCKYSLITLRAFERRCTKSALLSVIWGRFSQPSILLFTKTSFIHRRIMTARANAVRHIAKETAPLINSSATITEFWARAFYESYRTELRPESSTGRSKEIVERYHERYADLTEILYGKADEDGRFNIYEKGKFTTSLRWAARRVLGKFTAAARLINNAFSFDGGLDYVLRKIKNHSGVSIDVTPAHRKHPILWSPILAWRLYRKGAFR